MQVWLFHDFWINAAKLLNFESLSSLESCFFNKVNVFPTMGSIRTLRLMELDCIGMGDLIRPMAHRATRKQHWFFVECLRASPALLSTCSCTVKLNEENSKCAGLAQQNGFGFSIIAEFALAGKRPSNIVHNLHKRV